MLMPPPGRIASQTSAAWRLSLRIGRHAYRGRYVTLASSIAFFAFLGLLPLVGAVALGYGMFTREERVVEHVRSLVQFLPGSSRVLLGRWMIDTITNRDGRDVGFLVSTLIAIFSSMRAGQAVIAGLNVACGVERRRGFFAKRGAAFLLVLAGSGLLFTALFALSALAFLERLVPSGYHAIVPWLRTAFWSTATIGATGALLLIYRYAPARPVPAWRRVVPGAVAATLLWLTATLAFGYYLGSFGQYQQTYGSLGAVVALQVWLFLSAYTLLLGARLNTELEDDRNPFPA